MTRETVSYCWIPQKHLQVDGPVRQYSYSTFETNIYQQRVHVWHIKHCNIIVV